MVPLSTGLFERSLMANYYHHLPHPAFTFSDKTGSIHSVTISYGVDRYNAGIRLIHQIRLGLKECLIKRSSSWILVIR